MRKPAVTICKNKGTDQLRGNRPDDQRLCFRYIDSTLQCLYFLNPKLKHLAIFCCNTAPFVSDLVRNPKDRFSHETALNDRAEILVVKFVTSAVVLSKFISQVLDLC